jgi:hypothetical protein
MGKRKTKYVFYVGVGNIKARDIEKEVEKMQERTKDFFGGADVLYIPIRDGDSHLEVLEVMCEDDG